MNEFRPIQTYYKEYSKDIWDYLIDMPYMPSRFDRDVLLKNGDEKHVKIWDYFFRIKHEDVGKPLQQEIKSLRAAIDSESASCEQKVRDINSSINDLRRAMSGERLKRIVNGFGSLLIGLSLVYYSLTRLRVEIIYNIIFITPFFFYSLIMFVGIIILRARERTELSDLENRAQRFRVHTKEKVDIARERIRVLEMHMNELLSQIPNPLSDSEVRGWLDEDFKRLWRKAKDSTGLGTRLLNIKGAENPIPILGPGELQHPERIPPQYKVQINPDFNKHLTARRAYYFDTHSDESILSEIGVEVLYGVYYLEHILIADDMLATHGLFYDFITGKESSQRTTEQYYKDVVAIATTKEFRQISVDMDSQDTIYIDDAPTFILSLADGEKRTVTFVNEKYFEVIREKIDISRENISKIFWIRESEETAENAIKALRFRLRIHKGDPE